MGMMMVENILFMHTLAQTAYTVQGPGLDTVSTVMVLNVLSTLTCGALFMSLKQMKLGDMVYYFPRYVITGCIGGIGVFVTITGFEVSGEAVKFVSGHFTGLLRFTLRRRPLAQSVGLSA